MLSFASIGAPISIAFLINGRSSPAHVGKDGDTAGGGKEIGPFRIIVMITNIGENE